LALSNTPERPLVQGGSSQIVEAAPTVDVVLVDRYGTRERLAVPLAVPERLTVELFERLVTPPAWHRDALCKEPPYRNLAWLVPRGTPPVVIEQMRSVCRACLVATECRRFARAHRDVIGMWAGTTAVERCETRRVPTSTGERSGGRGVGS
jgi:hypothetical protein